MRKIIPIVGFIFIWLIITWQFWFKGLIPAPLDFLVGFYGPWRDHYAIPIKNSAISDVVNQIIPWKTFTIAEWQAGRIPLWNPYNFSGTPHAANWQSAVFYPLNSLMLIFGLINGWSLYVLAQPLLAGLFTYLFSRSLKLSPVSALLSGTSFAFSGFMTSWLEWGTLGHALLWLPASLWAIEKYSLSRNTKYLILNTLFLSLSLLAGHLQISLYVTAVTLAYFWYRTRKLNLWLVITPLALTAFQLFPTLELYWQSVRSHAISPGWFEYFRIPLEYLATFVAPDFFGNPTTRNEWGRGSYVEMMGYVGLIPLILSLSAIKLKSAKFFVGVIIISLLLSLRTPLANILYLLKIPVLATSSPGRIIGLISFSLSILAGMGLDKLRHLPLKLFGFILAGLWIIAFVFNLSVSQRNLILPSIIFITFIIVIFISRRFKLSLFLVSCFLFLVSVADLYRFHHKFVPYTSRDYWYPTFGIRQKLIGLHGIDRTFGLFDGNLNLPFSIYSAEGYDPLSPARYGELASTQATGTVTVADRSPGVTLAKNDSFTIPLLNLLSAKNIIQPTVHGAASWELHLWEYPGQFSLVYDDGNYQIFTNHQSLPRYFLTTNYLVESEPQKIINQILESDQKIVLEQSPNLDIQPIPHGGDIQLNTYLPNRVELTTATTANSLLYLSDNFYPGWQAHIDGQPAPILRANYAFRAVAVPSGNHTIKFSYQPFSFKIGIAVAAGSAILLIIFSRKRYVA